MSLILEIQTIIIPKQENVDSQNNKKRIFHWVNMIKPLLSELTNDMLLTSNSPILFKHNQLSKSFPIRKKNTV